MMKTRNPAQKTVLIMAGGTGGHVFPALAVARKLRQQNHRVEWLGTAQGIESEVVTKENIPLHYIRVSGLRGKGRLAMLAAPFRLLIAISQALVVLWRLRPCCVLGMGGFASGPGGIAAWLLRKPLLIHEQNAIAGLTNRILKPLASRVFEAYPNAFGSDKNISCIGNPLRESVLKIPLPADRIPGREGPLRLLVMGGSLGAATLNRVVPEAIGQLKGRVELQIWHQAGRSQIQSAEEAYRDAGVGAKIVPFIEDMDEAYGWADLVICRAGALTISELACVGLAAILVPYPHAVDDHQTLNARYLEEAGAALVIPQARLTASGLADLFINRFSDKSCLLEMAKKARAAAHRDAAEQLATHCLEYGYA